MTTPSTFNTPDRIIRTAMINAGLLQEGDDPTSEQYAEYMPRLNDVINLEQSQGLKLWLQSDQLVTLIAGQASYTLKLGGDVNIIKPTRVIQGYYLDAANNRRPLLPMSRDEYTRLSNVVNLGAINSYFTQKNYLDLTVSFWLTPDAEAATGTAHLIIQNQVTNLISLTDTMNFAQEWFIFLHWALADEICTGQPKAIMDRCSQRAETYRAALDNWDVEDASTSFAPDQRIVQDYGRFR